MFQRWQVGEVEITAVAEIVLDIPPGYLVAGFDPDLIAEHLPSLQPHHLTEDMQLRLAIQSYCVVSGGTRIVVDTCFGNDHAGLPVGDVRTEHLASLTEAGFAPDHVDVVLCTHLHHDHVGWNTMLVDGDWVPTFPNAQYLFGAREYEHWRDDDDPNGSLAESIEPIVAAGMHRLVATDHRLTDEVALVPTPGHTPGHVSVRIESAGAVAFITGDMVHHPAQIVHHTWPSGPDVDPVTSVATRASVFATLAAEDALVLGTHFAAPSGGRIVARHDGGWDWEPRR